ncbi:MAG: hypothetical protein A2750_00255 [Candidatus Yanofskybacteria bacterium RIFCSPHIGHO2_01_FULL_45_42]|nr:MAG: hypothetical protein A2750_00255 [Candidatus Yanofskybacteria bacterium RIFCSPHIGHO2_01_FULL_45_42]
MLAKQEGIAVISHDNYILFPGVTVRMYLACQNANTEWPHYLRVGNEVVYALKYDGSQMSYSTSKEDMPSEILFGFYSIGTVAKVRSFQQLSDTRICFELEGLVKCHIKEIDLKRQKAGMQIPIATDLIRQIPGPAVAANSQKTRAEINSIKISLAALTDKVPALLQNEDFTALARELKNADSFQKEIDIIRKLIYLISSRYLKKLVPGMESIQELLAKKSFEEELVVFNGLLSKGLRSQISQKPQEIGQEQGVKVGETKAPENPQHKARLDKCAEVAPNLRPADRTQLEQWIKNYSSPKISPQHDAAQQKYCDLIDKVLEYPWGKRTEDCFDFDEVRKKFDEELYGLETVKREMYGIIAVLKQRRKANLLGSPGDILCLVGKPGVGKSVSIIVLAHAIGRHYQGINLGGINRIEDLTGQQFTFVGSTPSFINGAISQSGVINPIIALEEIDKMRGPWGDPSAELMLILDPVRNHEIRDKYFPDPIRFDYGEVLFICTANSLTGIPPALLSRMLVLEIPGYATEDKFNIAQKYLIPRWAKETGLAQLAEYQIDSEAIRRIIAEYTEQEPGVRLLEHKIKGLFKSIAVAREYHGKMLDKVVVTARDVPNLVSIDKSPCSIGFRAKI